MKIKLYAFFLCLGLSVSFIAAAQQARAALGGTVDSIESDKQALSAVRRAATAQNGYTVHEIGSAETTVREYVSPSGIVFGIAWNGLAQPELTQLLGSYATEYQEALQQTPCQKGSRRLQVKAPDIVVEKWGHMRSMRGRAYAPALIPPGISADEIR